MFSRARARHARRNLALNLVPIVGIVLAQLVLPLLECGLLYASLAADRGDPPRLRHLSPSRLHRPARWRPSIAASLVIFAAESLVAQAFGDVNMLVPAATRPSLCLPACSSRRTPPASSRRCRSCSCRSSRCSTAPGFGTAFAQSFAAFARNPGPLLLFGALSFALLMLGLATSGFGLLLALPWSAAASYAAWKDIFSVALTTAACRRIPTSIWSFVRYVEKLQWLG